MVNSFQQISSEQQQTQIEKCPLEDQKICSNSQKGKNIWTRCIWRNIQKIVTLLVLVYLIVLIFNLLSCKETLLTISLPIKQEGKNSLDGQQLQHLQNSQISKQNVLQEILNQNIGFADDRSKNQVLTEIRSTQATTKSQHIKQNQISHNSQQKNQKVISNHNLPKQISPSHGVSVIIAQKQLKKQDRSDFFKFVQDINKNIKDKQHQKVYGKFRKIYSQLNETPRSILRSLSFEKTKQIINKYAQAEDSMLLKLIAQNSQLNTQLSQNDIEYRKYLNPQNPINSQQEEPFCVIVSSHNNAHNSKIIRTLNSVYNQNYKYFKVVIVDQNSGDKTSTIIKDYLSLNQRNIKMTSLISIDTDSQVFALWTAAKHCQEDTFAIYLDGNSQLLGKDVFNMMNYQISNFKAHLVYGGQYTLDVAEQKISLFQPASYDESEQFTLAFRKIPKKYGRIMGFRTNALMNFPQNYMQFNGKPFEYTGIDSLAVTMLEMSCGKFKTIKEPLGLVLIDSKIQQQQKKSRQHELRQISQKLKIDIC